MSGDALVSARLVALLVERLLLDHLAGDVDGESSIAMVDMAGMMAAVEVTMVDGTVVVVEANPT